MMMASVYALRRIQDLGVFSLYPYRLYFSYSGYSQTLLDPVFDADHDARISSGWAGAAATGCIPAPKSWAGGDIG